MTENKKWSAEKQELESFGPAFLCHPLQTSCSCAERTEQLRAAQLSSSRSLRGSAAVTGWLLAGRTPPPHPERITFLAKRTEQNRPFLHGMVASGPSRAAHMRISTTSAHALPGMWAAGLGGAGTHSNCEDKGVHGLLRVSRRAGRGPGSFPGMAAFPFDGRLLPACHNIAPGASLEWFTSGYKRLQQKTLLGTKCRGAAPVR